MIIKTPSGVNHSFICTACLLLVYLATAKGPLNNMSSDKQVHVEMKKKRGTAHATTSDFVVHLLTCFCSDSRAFALHINYYILLPREDTCFDRHGLYPSVTRRC